MAKTIRCRGKCGEEKDPSEFSPNKLAAGGRRKLCKACRSKGEAARQKARAQDNLRGQVPFGTPSEREAAESYLALGSVSKVAAALGLKPAVVRGRLSELAARAARRGWAPGSDMTKTTPDGFHVKGVSTLYDRFGEKRGQWVKTKADQEHQLAALLDAVQTIIEPIKGVAKPSRLRRRTGAADKDLLAVYPMGDPHIGMLSWSKETGQAFDLDIAERNLATAADQLVELAPPTEQALVINAGDFLHADSAAGTTTRGTRVDLDSRWPKVFSVGIKIMRRIIDRALEKHDRVHVISEIGNHDTNSAVVLALCLAGYYERDPRVTVDTSPEKYHWFRFGSCLIGTTHGDEAKASMLPGVMACDRARDWGETEHRYWYCGHVHHERVIDLQGCTVEYLRTLAPADAWARGKGYRAEQDMRLYLLHRRYGRVASHVVGIQQVWDAQQGVVP